MGGPHEFTGKAELTRSMDESGNRKPSAILAIGIFKLVKGLLLAATGAGALSLLHKDVEKTLSHWIALLRVDPDNEMIHGMASRLFSLTPRQLKEISAGTFFYAALLLIEGIGLLMRKGWAEYLTVITTAALLPVEIYELIKRFTGIRVGVLILNLMIVGYLIWRIKIRQVEKNNGVQACST